MKTDDAFLTLGRDVIVSKNQILARPCGIAPCLTFHRPLWLRVLVVVTIGITLFAGLGLVVARSSPATAVPLERVVRLLSITTLVVIVGAFVLPWLVRVAEEAEGLFAQKTAAAGAVGVGAVLVALAAQLAPYVVVVDRKVGRVAGAVKNAGARLKPLLIRFVGAVVGPLLLVLGAVAWASYGAKHGLGPNQLGVFLAVLGWLLVFGSGGDLNEWSLHPFYRDRLRSAFAVDPRTWPKDDPREDPLDQFPSDKGEPRLLICAAVNLADQRVTSPGRPVASWVFESGGTEGHDAACMGSAAMAQAPLPGRDPEDGLPHAEASTFTPGQLPLPLKHLGWTWTAVAVSGAAVSPTMGKMTTPERFLLALANVRLGVWYPNPRYLADDDERKWYLIHHPRPWYLAKEALGLHKANDRWLYLTDGGHYENLGLVELLRRGCREILCFDASGDRPDTFGTIAEAMRLAREELNAEIVIDPAPMKPDGSGVSPIGVRAATVQYAEDGEPTGWIVVAKLAVPKTAAFDIIDLARTLRSFPNNPTSDQLYTDQKFEAYRALGHHLGERAAVLVSVIRRRIDRGDGVRDAVAYANTHELAEAPSSESS